jgi:hypothetical protein
LLIMPLAVLRQPFDHLVFEVACRTSCSEVVGGETLSLVKRPQLTFSEIALKAGLCQNRNRAPKMVIGIGGVLDNEAR